jgi:hypothetical protein
MLLFDFEDGDVFLRNVGLSPNYTALQRRRCIPRGHRYEKFGSTLVQKHLYEEKDQACPHGGWLTREDWDCTGHANFVWREWIGICGTAFPRWWMFAVCSYFIQPAESLRVVPLVTWPRTVNVSRGGTKGNELKGSFLHPQSYIPSECSDKRE